MLAILIRVFFLNCYRFVRNDAYVVRFLYFSECVLGKDEEILQVGTHFSTGKHYLHLLTSL